MGDKYLLSNRPKRERGRCPVCDRRVAVDVVGRFVNHGPACEGSEQVATPHPPPESASESTLGPFTTHLRL